MGGEAELGEDAAPCEGRGQSVSPAGGRNVAFYNGVRERVFMRPVRRSYKCLRCNTVSVMSLELAETYARDPTCYPGIFCCGCLETLPVGKDGEFVWNGSTDKVGT